MMLIYLYTIQDEDQDLHDRAQHYKDVCVVSQSVQWASETSVQNFSTKSQTTYDLVVS